MRTNTPLAWLSARMASASSLSSMESLGRLVISMIRSALMPARITMGISPRMPLKDPLRDPAMDTNMVMVP